METKIIALIDGSTYSESVCQFAAWISGRTGEAVKLYHVLGRREAPEQQDLSGAIKLGARTALMDELAELDAQRSKLVAHRGRAILEDGHSILTKAGVSEISTRLRHGDIVETLADVEGNASIVLIGKRGEGADFAKGHLGSNLERIVRASKKPVFVAARAFKPIEKVLIAYDGGSSAVKAVDHVAKRTVFQGLDVNLVTIGSPTTEIKKGLEDAIFRLQAAGITAKSSVVEGQPDAALGELVEEQGYDLVVMGAYGHSRIRSLIIGSTTTQMIQSCKVPVVLVR